ncbi:MAG: sigma-70 family RNA polymerase sigma factor [Elusimicrobiota bacterium]|jgi:RNA polymerase sigma-70 factor (ECF subfamily)|nr:sigma-70 family RNA polymerase sigma factor [Elusimicrobiota bacterium]
MNMKQLKDAQLVVLFKNGDAKAFEELVLRYQAHIYTYILSLTKNPDSASDLTQDLFIKVYKNLSKYNEENKLKNWIFTLARNIVMDHFRKHNKRFIPLENTAEDEFSIINILPDGSPKPLETAIENYKKEMVNSAIGKLSQDEQELIHLKDSFTFQEIADMQKKPIGTLLSKFNRSLKKIRKILSETAPEVCDEYMQ